MARESHEPATPPPAEAGNAAARSARSRLRLVLAAVATVAIGLAARFGLDGVVGDVVGGALYAALIYLLVAFVWTRGSRFVIAAVALLICAAVELLQLTAIPAQLAEAFPPSRLVFGTTFAPLDLAAYAVGAVMAALLDPTFRRRH